MTNNTAITNLRKTEAYKQQKRQSRLLTTQVKHH